jgi:uncharacterized membrane protein HdeD (DUF308 family)
MVMTLANRWWAIALRGLAAILFGILTFISPVRSLVTLVIVFGAYAIVDGALNLATALQGHRAGKPWGALIVGGIASIIAGVLTFMWPGITALVLLFVIAFWAMVTGVAQVVAAIRLRKQIRGEWLMAFCGALSVVFGVLMLIAPGAGALAVVLWIGAYALIFGASLVGLAFRLRSWSHSPEQRMPTGGMPTPA